ncbi:MAG TPA: hypothetical protein VMT62_15850, partial [Syntrophorhabdaceae bacterium]|nr:hypothetical protein [Syntrophorhabdaceae bacterium]
ALVAAYEVSGNQKHLDRAQGLMDSCLNGFWDHENGGFFDTEDEVVGMRLKGIEDTPHPSANGLAVIVLLKLALISGRDAYRQHAGELLDVFAGDAQLMGIHGAYYFCGIDAFQHMLKTTVNAPPDSALAQSVRAIYYPYECIVYGEDAGGLIPCVGNTCYEPLDTADKFKEFVTTLSS